MQKSGRTQTLRELDEIIARLAQGQTPENGPPDGGIRTHRMLVELGRDSVESPPQEAVYILDQLCRKLAIAKRVWAAYTSDWRKPADAVPLPAEGWTLLVAVLSRYAAASATNDDGLHPLRMKWLNGALLARELAPDEAKEAGLDRVGAILDGILESVRAQCRPSP